MKTAVLGVLAAGMLAFPATPASAADPMGGCFLDRHGQRTLTDSAAVIGVRAFVQEEDGTPAQATIGCKVQVDGVDAAGTTRFYSGLGVVAGADPISFDAAGDGVVALCQNVDGGAWECASGDPLPEEIYDFLDAVDGTLRELFWELDLPLCPVTSIVQGDYGVATIGQDGDVAAVEPVGEVWECPPYGH